MVSRRQLLKLSALGTASFAAPLAYSASNITMTHNTGNPLGSTSPKDLSDNARNLDYLCLGPNHSYLDRKGVPRKSWKGMEEGFSADQAARESKFAAFLDSSGYEAPVAYVTGIILSRATQTVTYLGKEYRVKSEFLPLETTVWIEDESKLKLIGDDSLRQEMANPNIGAAMVALPIGTVRDAIKFVTPEQFGCSVSATDNRSNFQAALDYSALNGLELVSNGDYDVSGPLYLPQFNLVWRGSGKIRNIYCGSDGQRKLCFYPGTYNPVYFDMLSYSVCVATQYGQAWIKFSTNSEASEYSVGDLVFIRSLQHYNGADGQIPLYGSNNRITAIDTVSGVVHLEYPILRALANPRIAKTGNTGILDALGEREIYCCYNARIDGISFESVNGHVTERGGMLGCSFNIPNITGLSGVYTNAVSFSMWTVGRIDCDLRGIEMAGCTTGSVLDVGTLVWRKSARSVAQAILSINENMASSVIKIRDLSAPEFDYPSQPLIHVLSAQENEVRIERLTAAMARGTIITFENLLKNGAGESQPSTKGNSVFIGMAIGGAALQRFCHMTNPGGANVENIIGGYFVGAPTIAAITMAGDAQQVRGTYSAGTINLNVATNSVVDAKAAGGITGYTRSANNKVMQNTAQYESKPKIISSQVTPIGQLNGESGAISFTPDLSKGSVQAVPFTSALSLAINNPVGASEGDSFILVLTNNNSTTAIIPTFGAAFIFFGEVIQSIAPGKRAMYRFSVLPNFAYVLELQRVGFT